MANSVFASNNSQQQDKEIWSSLIEAIAKSSGFRSWQQERNIGEDIALDQQVKIYLKETLETLAY